MKEKKTLALLALVPAFVLSSCFFYDGSVAEKAQFSSSKDGVGSFYSLLSLKDRDLSPLLKEGNCYNVTTDNIKGTGASIFKFKDECTTYLRFDDDIYFFAGGFGGFGFVNAVTCDYDGNGKADILYTYSWGSGIHRSVVSVFDLTTFMVTVLFSTFDDEAFSEDEWMSDLVLEKGISDGDPVYEAYISELSFGDGFLVSSASEEKLGKTIDFADYASNEPCSTKIGEASGDNVDPNWLDFTIEGWANAGTEERGRMIDSFLNQYRLDAFDLSEVERYLGQPDAKETVTLGTDPTQFGGYVYKYFLGNERSSPPLSFDRH
jgi:hypothetical protein